MNIGFFFIAEIVLFLGRHKKIIAQEIKQMKNLKLYLN